MMNDVLRNYSELDLRNLFDTHILSKNVNTNPFNLAGINSTYYDVHDTMPNQFRNTRFQYNVLHLNLQGLTSKFDKLQNLLSQISEAHVEIDYILCEICLNYDSAHLFELPNYNLIYKNRTTKSKGGVAMYIRDNIQYILQEDHSNFVEGEFESIFIESSRNGLTTVFGEIYRTKNSNVTLSTQCYESVINKLQRPNHHWYRSKF